MGFLRKLGKKLKKGFQKLFSTKLGKIAGTIGLYMAMGAVAKSFTGWFSSTFGKAAAETASQAALEETAKKTAEEALTKTALEETVKKEVTGEIATKTVGESLKESALSLEKTLTKSKEVLNTLDNPASTFADKANTVIDAIDTNIINGGDLTVSNSLTDSVSTVAETVTTAPNLSNVIGDEIVVDNINIGDASDIRELTDFSSISETAIKEAKDFKYSELDLGDKFKKFGQETKDFVMEEVIPQDRSEFIGDAVRTQAIVALDEYINPVEEPFVSAGVAPKPQGQAPQAAYLQEVGPQYARAMNSNTVPSFEQIMASTMYGPGTPQYLSQFNPQQFNILPLPAA
tara:strand:+ start:2245 stop:3279 length:1035 start_codon:yes stop_codon:yes gene_type:complete